MWAYHPTTRNMPNLVRNLIARRARHAPRPARRRGLHRRRRRVAVLRAGPLMRDPDGLHRGVRPHRLADADRPRCAGPSPTCSACSGRSRRASTRAPRHREPAVSGRRSWSSPSAPTTTPSTGWSAGSTRWRPTACECVVQHGTSGPPRAGRGRRLPRPRRADRTCRRGRRGGLPRRPATITESRAARRRPIVVPARPGASASTSTTTSSASAPASAAKGLISVAADEEVLPRADRPRAGGAPTSSRCGRVRRRRRRVGGEVRPARRRPDRPPRLIWDTPTRSVPPCICHVT